MFKVEQVPCLITNNVKGEMCKYIYKIMLLPFFEIKMQYTCTNEKLRATIKRMTQKTN